MDRKSIILIAVCFALVLGWGPLLNKFWPTPPPVPGATNTVNTATSPVTNPAATPASTNTPSLSASVPNVNARLVVHQNIPEELLTISNSNARYVFTSRGGGLK